MDPEALAASAANSPFFLTRSSPFGSSSSTLDGSTGTNTSSDWVLPYSLVFSGLVLAILVVAVVLYFYKRRSLRRQSQYDGDQDTEAGEEMMEADL